MHMCKSMSKMSSKVLIYAYLISLMSSFIVLKKVGNLFLGKKKFYYQKNLLKFSNFNMLTELIIYKISVVHI